MTRATLACCLLALGFAAAGGAGAPSGPAPAPAPETARVLMLGVFHFDNPGLDAVKYEPRDVMRPAEQQEIASLAVRLARFAPTKVLLEYPAPRDAVMQQRYAEYRAGGFILPSNEIYQLGFRVASLAGLPRVHGIDVDAPPVEEALWSYLPRDPAAERKLKELIATESTRLAGVHRALTLKEILLLTNTAQEDRRNKGFYMLLNEVAAANGLFHGADASAHWWHRNLRMYALVQMHAGPGERVLVIVGSGHAALLRDFLRADAARVEEDVQRYLE
jgi:hypothetical protein